MVFIPGALGVLLEKMMLKENIGSALLIERAARRFVHGDGADDGDLASEGCCGRLILSRREIAAKIVDGLVL